jgi:ribosome-associated toxin RatA of RatAB toxin-antitoxin module
MILPPMPASARSQTLDVRLVRADAATMFRVAADVEHWPDHLPHYRYVRFTERDATGGIVEMSANRPFGPLNWPTWWTSLMHVVPERPAIRFRHIAGVTTRMDVEWRFVPVPGGTEVTIEHLWDGPRVPVVGAVAARWVIGPVFVHGIASRTLAGLARVAEHAQTSS